jgi:hypothetical protein
MKQLRHFLYAFITTVFIVGALMMGCGSGGSGGGNAVVGNTTTSSGTEYTCSWGYVSSNTDCTTLVSYNSCEQGYYNITQSCLGQKCQKNCVRTVGYSNNTSPAGNNNTTANCTNHCNYCSKATNCCGYCEFDLLAINGFRLLSGLSPIKSSDLTGGFGMCVPGSGK